MLSLEDRSILKMASSCCFSGDGVVEDDAGAPLGAAIAVAVGGGGRASNNGALPCASC